MRHHVAWLCVLLLAACIGPGSGGDGGTPMGDGPRLALEPFLSRLDDPVFLTHAGDGSGRLFIVEQKGIVRVWDDGLQEEPFLDIAAGGPHARVLFGGERGLLGLAFHPDYADNGRFFVFYTAPGGDVTIAEYRNPEPADDEADPTTGKVLLTQDHSEFSNHNGGALAFGADGMLYAGIGDGGSGGDPHNRAQDVGTLLGKVLRLDVDTPGDLTPDDNPFVGREGRDEIWAYGLRNPWRLGFDRETGDLWIADVGQNAWEEVNRQAAGAGGGANYGWSRFEGSHVYRSDRNALDAVAPVAEYKHDWGGAKHCSVTGGYVYRGDDLPALAGAYVFGDYCSGYVWTLAGTPPTMALAADTGLSISSFGEDEDGELYVVDHGGDVRKVVAA